MRHLRARLAFFALLNREPLSGRTVFLLCVRSIGPRGDTTAIGARFNGMIEVSRDRRSA